MDETEAKITISAQDLASGPLRDVAHYAGEASKEFNYLQETAKLVHDGFGGIPPSSVAAANSLAAMNKQLETAQKELQNLDVSTSAYVMKSREIASVQGEIAAAHEVSSHALEKHATFLGMNTEKLNILKDALKQVAPGLGRMGDLTAIAEGAAYGAMAIGMAELVKHSVEVADAFEGIDTRAKVIFGTDYPGMSAASDGLSQSLGRSQVQMLGAITQTTAIAEGLGLSKTAAEQMSTQLSSLGVDIGKAFHTSDADAIQAIQSALEGNTRALRQYGIVMNDNTLQEYAHAAGIKAKVVDMDSEQKAVLEANYVLAKSSDIHNAATASTGGLDDQLKRLNATWSDFSKDLGEIVLPGVTAVFSVINTVLSDAITYIKFFADEWKAMIELISMGVGNIKGTVGGVNFGGVNSDGQKIVGAGIPGYQQLANGQEDFTKNTPEGQKVKDETDKMNQAYEDLQKSLDKTGAAFNSYGVDMDHTAKGSADAAKQLEATKTALEALNQSYEDASKSIDTKLLDLDTSHKDRMASIQDSIDKTKQSIQDLADAFQKSMDDINNAEADALIKGQDNITKLQAQLDKKLQEVESKKQGSGSVSVALQDEVAKLQDELDAAKKGQQNAEAMVGGMPVTTAKPLSEMNDEIVTMQKNLENMERQKDLLSGSGNKSVPAVLTEGITQLRANITKVQGELDAASGKASSAVMDAFNKRKDMSAPESKITDEEAKRVTDTDKYNDSLKKLNTTLDKYNNSKDVENAAYGAQRTQLIQTQQALISFHDQYVAAMNDMAKVTKDQLTSMKNDLSDLAATMTSAQAKILGENRVSIGGGTTIPSRIGGGYAEGLTRVGEGGPELVSLPAGSFVHSNQDSQKIAGGMAQSITINMGGVTVKNEADEDRLVKKLARMIQLQKLSSAA
jgi:hypothetical protein